MLYRADKLTELGLPREPPSCAPAMNHADSRNERRAASMAIPELATSNVTNGMMEQKGVFPRGGEDG